eukprot:2779737-Amphidinium_carterae.2
MTASGISCIQFVWLSTKTLHTSRGSTSDTSDALHPLVLSRLTISCHPRRSKSQWLPLMVSYDDVELATRAGGSGGLRAEQPVEALAAVCTCAMIGCYMSSHNTTCRSDS